MKKPRTNLLRFALIAVLLVILPAFSSLFLIVHVTDEQKTIAEEAAIARLDERARDLFANLDASTFFTPRLKRLGKAILPLSAALDKSRPEALASATRAMVAASEKAFSEVNQRFSVYVFDSEGQIVNTGLASETSIPAMQFVWNGLNKVPGADYSIRKPEVAQLLGRDFRIRHGYDKNNICIAFDNYGRNGLFYHSRPEKGLYGMIAFIELSLDFSRLLMESVKDSSTPDSPAILRDLSESIIFGEGFHPAPQQLYKLASDSSPGAFASSGHLWKKFTTGNMEVLLGQTFSPDFFRHAVLAAIVTIMLLVIVSLVYFYRMFFSEHAAWLSIRFKLVAIFIFAVYLPILGLFMLGYNGLRDRRTVLENDARKGILDILMEVDSGFSQKERQIAATFEKFYRDPEWQKGLSGNWQEADMAVRKSNGSASYRENFFNWFDVRDIYQNQLYSTSTGESNDRVKAMGRTMSLICLEKVMSQRLQESGIKLKQSDLVLANLLENPVLGFSNLFEQPGRVLPMDFEGSKLYWYWNYYPDKNSRVAFMLGNTGARINIINYLNEVLKRRFSLDNTGLRLTAFLPENQTWFPEGSGRDEKLQNLFKLTMLNAKAETTVIESAGRQFIAACQPGIKLSDFYIACLYPVSEIDARIWSMRSQIYLGVAFILIIAVFTGLLLSKTFLQPVGELNLGLQALTRRDTDFRVQISNQDELGELGQTFNQMMSEIKEMLLAGAVQQCLIPDTCPAIPGFDSLIYNRMATDVGGDYADMFALPDQRFLIVLGDVTGHGVSSSILTAMVKAAVFRFASRDTDLQTILKNLSTMIFELLQRRKLMTFCAMILDSNSRRFSLANAGHPFPLICNTDGQIRQIEHAALPLGVSVKRSVYEVVEGSLEPGEMMMLYTDGIVEGANPAGKEFGLQRVEHILAATRIAGIEAAKNKLLEDFLQHYQRAELDDDLTFILIKRQADDSELPG